jgi:hypothetical protein
MVLIVSHGHTKCCFGRKFSNIVAKGGFHLQLQAHNNMLWWLVGWFIPKSLFYNCNIAFLALQ